MGFFSNVWHGLNPVATFKDPKKTLEFTVDPVGTTVRTGRNQPNTLGTHLDPFGGLGGDSNRHPAPAPITYSNPFNPAYGAPGSAQQPIMLPQVTNVPQALPNAAGYNAGLGVTGAPPNTLPYLASMQRQNVLGPLQQPNYGLGVVSPFQGAQFQYPGMAMQTPPQGMPPSAIPPMSGAPNSIQPGFGQVGFNDPKAGLGGDFRRVGYGSLK